jgi:uncharacterized protein YegP (UPF0339 family)
VARFQMFQDVSGRWRWRLIDGNNKKTATSGEAFASRSNALRAARNVKSTAASAALPVQAVRVASQPPSLLTDLLRGAARRRVR